MKRVAILLSGGGSNMARLVQSMTGDHPARPCLVLSNDPNAGGLVRARNWGIATAAVDHRPFAGDRAAFEAALSGPLRAARPDVICLAGFMRILTGDFIAEWEGRMLNIHPSLLPSYRGLRTHARALEAGERDVGCTVHEVIPDLDAGPILGQARVPVLEGDDPATLAARVLTMEHQLYPAVLYRYVLGDRTPVIMDWTADNRAS
ncbi:phosphoribosylglycinamide formyltransferase [Palleronia sp.]|uniref:phosphoribosylglycinamide formyltransferase n=1 Tax=Palleronia sp. TaxID=1940284 RepID=UPI0035C7C01D